MLFSFELDGGKAKKAKPKAKKSTKPKATKAKKAPAKKSSSGKKSKSKKGGNFLGTVSELFAPAGWESFVTAAGLLALDRTDNFLRKKKDSKKQRGGNEGVASEEEMTGGARKRRTQKGGTDGHIDIMELEQMMGNEKLEMTAQTGGGAKKKKKKKNERKHRGGALFDLVLYKNLEDIYENYMVAVRENPSNRIVTDEELLTMIGFIVFPNNNNNNESFESKVTVEMLNEMKMFIELKKILNDATISNSNQTKMTAKKELNAIKASINARNRNRTNLNPGRNMFPTSSYNTVSQVNNPNNQQQLPILPINLRTSPNYLQEKESINGQRIINPLIKTSSATNKGGGKSKKKKSPKKKAPKKK